MKKTMLFIITCILFSSFTQIGFSSVITTNYTSNNTFTIPTGTTWMQIEAIGGGGSGGAGNNKGGTVYGGGGGAGGQYAIKNISVSAGQVYNFTVADAQTTQSTNGLNTTFTYSNGTIIVKAIGGQLGTSATTSANGVGGTGSTTNGVGTTVYKGGNGANGNTNGGGGGGGAGSTGNGGSTTTTTAGTGTSLYGGDGGVGQTTSNVNGNPGNNYGGAGSGGKRTSVGGAGAQGIIILTYNQPDVTNSCTYSGSGNWTINIADNCNITTTNNLGRNSLIINGSTTINDRLYVTGSIWNFTQTIFYGIYTTVWGAIG